MKKVVIGLALFVGMAIYFLVQKTPNTVLEKEPISSAKPLKIKDSITGLKEIAKRKITLKIPGRDSSLHPCHKVIDNLAESSFEEIKEQSGELFDVFKNVNCINEYSRVVKNNPQMLELLKNCALKYTPYCDALIFFLKSWAVSLKYPDTMDVADLDESILANKLMFNFNSNPALPLDVLNKNLVILDELIAKDPSLYGAQKAKLIHLFAKEFQYNEDVEEEFQNTLESLNSFRSDPEIEEMVMVKTLTNKKFKKEDALNRIDEFIEKFPGNPKGPYYRAALEWNLMQNPKEAKFWLEKAKSLAPNDRQVIHSYESLKNAKLGQSIFYFSFQFNLEKV